MKCFFTLNVTEGTRRVGVTKLTSFIKKRFALLTVWILRQQQQMLRLRVSLAQFFIWVTVLNWTRTAIDVAVVGGYLLVGKSRRWPGAHQDVGEEGGNWLIEQSFQSPQATKCRIYRVLPSSEQKCRISNFSDWVTRTYSRKKDTNHQLSLCGSDFNLLNHLDEN